MSNWELDLREDFMNKTMINRDNEAIEDLKRDKARAKSAFTKARHKLLQVIDESDEMPNRDTVKELRKRLEIAEEHAMDIMGHLYDEYKKRGEIINVRKTAKELEQLETEFTEAENECQSFMVSTKDSCSAYSEDRNEDNQVATVIAENSGESVGPVYQPNSYADNAQSLGGNINDKSESESNALGHDMWKQLKRIAIPVFSGDKRSYEAWRAAFMSCVDKAPATAEYKLLQLRQYLSGEALKVVENLGYSESAYVAAKERLERKYGGKRRQIARYMDELENFKPIRLGNSRDIDKFADLIDITVVNLKDAGRTEELGNGSLYNKLQQKLPESMLAQYHRWIFEKSKSESVESLKEWIIQEAEFQTIASETVRGLDSNDARRHKPGINRTFISNAEGIGKNIRVRLCKVCNGQHGVWNCDMLRKMDVPKRWSVAKENRLCYRCLGDDHIGLRCPRSRKCGINGCKELHNRMLHKDRVSNCGQHRQVENSSAHKNCIQEKPEKIEIEPLNEGEVNNRTMIAKDRNVVNHVTLRTVPVIVRNGNRSLTVNALLDDASTRTYINSDVAAELGLEGRLQTMTVNVLNDECESFDTMPVEFDLESLNGRTRNRIVAFTTHKVTGNMKPIDWRQHQDKWAHLRDIEFPNIGERPKVDMLIGLDYSDLHYSFKDVRGKPGEPIARLTPLGWTCIGNPDNDNNLTHFNYTYFVGKANDTSECDVLLKKFWDIEHVKSIGDDEILSVEDKEAVKIVEASMRYNNGRYEVAVPWKSDPGELPNNYNMAYRRLENTEKRLIKDTNVGNDYVQIIDKYVEKGYIRKVTVEEESKSGKWYLPHFPVIRPDKETSKTRIVFDASAKYENISLNSVIHQGPKLQKDLFDVLLRFRKNPVALVCDIAEMYLRINIAPQDRPFHRFLWRSMESNRKPDEYEFNSVVFGVNSSPFQAQYVAQKHAEKLQNSHPRAAETVLYSTYMDDSMDSVISDNEGILLYEQLSDLWSKAGMYARKWLSNSEAVLECIPKEDRASEVNLDDGNLPTVKTLGVMWKSNVDMFTFNANPPDEDFVYTKRNFLRKVAMLFDPLGFIAPYIVRAKMLLQEMWLDGYNWDDLLDNSIMCKAKSWFNELNDLKQIEVQRCLRLTDKSNEILDSSIHTFVDSSVEGFGAVSYMRNVYKSGLVSTRFIAAKSKVAPITSVSIPRLELMAAVLGLKLALSIAKPLDIPSERLVFWSDSMNVLWWIRGKSRDFKPFVANRVGEIHRNSSPTQWRYVPTKLNPADLVSRGRTVAQLKFDLIWWNGPDFLLREEHEWPVCQISKGLSCDKEVKHATKLSTKVTSETGQDITLVTMKNIDVSDWRLNPEHFSSWLRLIRVRSWINRFVENCRLKSDLRRKGGLSVDEIEEAEIQIVRDAQISDFREDYIALMKGQQLPLGSRLLSLKPKIDEYGLLRSDGRLQYADFLPFDTKYPVILPRKNRVTKLIVKYYHEKGRHVCGTNQTLSMLSAKYWIISAREEIRECENECYICRKRKAKAAEQVMAPLPNIRFRTPLHAFARTAVDFGGPFITVQGRGKRREKRYLCLFTCLLTRAVHIEIAFGLDTDSFLNAFYRMASRRGMPQEVISDNGTNFVGANKELQQLVSFLDKDKIYDNTSNRGVKWHFNPPLAPHFGGVHETMIKAAKKAIYAILGNADITDEELLTAFIGAEALINSRPLTYQSADSRDVVPLTPNHFLHGLVGGTFAPETVDTTDFNPRKRWRRIQELIRHFWQRWIKEWLPGLNRRNKWTKTEKDLKINDIVLVMNPNLQRGHWPLGRIVDVFPGKDKHVRVAKVKIGQNLLVRPITKLCPLEVND